eukprot:CAMPEP_0171566434 /NCGR_PEP_ID=MMETSP0961-20121227/563_1 /TAXON_ID=87120 /ORGANISM="Aurantiochytrium limacinum, Strain ATCCMYA-1381" /LENGTH=924 /DNA_ID=CAMNT_0012120165 /DNA_START=307 /DNA_END=3082 /DNA_ORIENTATION=-
MSDNLPGNETSDIVVYKAVLFPFFVIIIGITVSYVLSRFAPMVPYTAVMYVIGTVMGVVSSETSGSNVLKESITLWSEIDPELLLLTFLPALIFGDALQVNWHLFQKSLPQTLTLAFPGVLVGTLLTGYVVYYIFPMGWSLNLCLTLGAILSATDPVAVTATLDDVDAPPRLKMINDGSAIVFFTIFSELYLAEQGIEGVGEKYDIPTGIAKFFRMSIGGALVGIAFSIMLNFVMWRLNRKLDQSEMLLQVAATIAFAYMSYFVAEVVCGTSGVLSVLFCGVTTSGFGLTMVHDLVMLNNVWDMIEYLGNTLLFCLGGVVWGMSMVGTSPLFSREAYAYILVLFVFMTLIRIAVLGVFYPVTTRLGMGANFAENVVAWWGGLRGAVGIALALSLTNDGDELLTGTAQEKVQQETSVLFGFVGAMALLTLIINAPFVEPLLRKLKLIGSSKARLLVLQCWHEGMRREMVDRLAELLEHHKFASCDVDIIRAHVPVLKDVADVELNEAREMLRLQKADEAAADAEAGVGDTDLLLTFKSFDSLDPALAMSDDDESFHRKSQGRSSKRSSKRDLAHGTLTTPFDRSELSNHGSSRAQKVLARQVHSDSERDEAAYDHLDSNHDPQMDSVSRAMSAEEGLQERPKTTNRIARSPSWRNSVRVRRQGAGNVELPMYAQQDFKRLVSRASYEGSLVMGDQQREIQQRAKELREIFVNLQRYSYWKQIEDSELSTHKIVDYTLLQSCDISASRVAQGGKIDDWSILMKDVTDTRQSFVEAFMASLLRYGRRTSVNLAKEYEHQLRVIIASAFIDAHRNAQRELRLQFSDIRGRLAIAEDLVLQESQAQVELARKYIEEAPDNLVRVWISHLVAVILLNVQVRLIRRGKSHGYLQEREVVKLFESVNEALQRVQYCRSRPEDHDQVSQHAAV